MTQSIILVLSMSLFYPRSMYSQNPIELGNVHWLRDITKAQVQSKQTGKPILILFQEIPGCSTCQRYGTQVMKYPLIVEAIETEFIPLAIHNNKGGEDGRLLKLFNEPAWNNPVVRIVDASLSDVVDRLDGDYSPKGIVSVMINALLKIKKPIPGYLTLLKESFTFNTKQITFGMYCFWEGEKQLGKLQGVTGTKPGFVQGHEVVQVTFDIDQISPERLMAEAKKQECASQIFADAKDLSSFSKINPLVKSITSFKADHEPQYYLMHTDYRYIPMLPIQASRINSVIGLNQNPNQYLSIGQLTLFDYYKMHPTQGNPKAYQNDLVNEWEKNADMFVNK